MKTRNIFALIAALLLSISSANASGLLDDTDLLVESRKGCGKVITFKTSQVSGQTQKEAEAAKAEPQCASYSEKETQQREQESNKNTPSGDTFEFFQPNAAYFLLVMLALSIAKLIK